MRSLLLLCSLTLAVCQDRPTGDPTDLTQAIARRQAALPMLPAARPKAAKPPYHGFTSLSEGIQVLPGKQVKLDGVILCDRGPSDGLEVLACLMGGKGHESLVRLITDNAEVVAAAFIAGLDLHPDSGTPPPEAGNHPARGTPVRIWMYWQPDALIDPDGWVCLDASCLVRDRVVQRAYPPLPWIYTGSQFREIPQMIDGKEVKVKRFMLSNTRSLAVNYDEPDCLLASPFPLAAVDNLFEVNSALSPAPNAKVQMVFERAILPLTLTAQADGILRHLHSALTDDLLVSLLQQYYSGNNPDRLAAVAIEVGPEVPRETDRRIRDRILEQAAVAKVWVVPVFVPPAAK